MDKVDDPHCFFYQSISPASCSYRSDFERNQELLQLVSQKLDAYKVRQFGIRCGEYGMRGCGKEYGGWYGRWYGRENKYNQVDRVLVLLWAWL